MPQTIDSIDDSKPDNRRRMMELLLMERLGLEEECLDPGFIADLPEAPPVPDQKIQPGKWLAEVEKHLDQLVKGGCKRRVLYWCLERLGNMADRARAGEVRHSEAFDDSPERSWISITKLPTREHMKTVSNQLEAALEVIRRHKDELLLVSSVLGDSVALPAGGMMSEGPSTDIDAVLMLRHSLVWARKLADSWQGLNEKQWIKSMGPLFLLEYVWFCTKLDTQSGHTKKSVGLHKKTKLTRVDVPNAMAIACLVDIYCEKGPTHEDLIDKRQDFQQRYPGLHKRMLALFRTLEGSVDAQVTAPTQVRTK
jgi:hypothetical protein